MAFVVCDMLIHSSILHGRNEVDNTIWGIEDQSCVGPLWLIEIKSSNMWPRLLHKGFPLSNVYAAATFVLQLERKVQVLLNLEHIYIA